MQRSTRLAMATSVVAAGSALEPHLPYARSGDGTWIYAPLGALLAVDDGARVVCHACGEQLTSISAGHLRSRHGMDPAGYRGRFGLNRKASLLAPALAQVRRDEGRRRWESNGGVRAGLAVGQRMAREGVLYELGAAAQPVGSRRSQGRSAASREGASPALRAHREQQSAAARQRWRARVKELGFVDVEDYLAVRRSDGSTAHRVRTELGCGGSVALRLLGQVGVLGGASVSSRESAGPAA